MTTALIDGDAIAYRTAASCEPTKIKEHLESKEDALFRCEELVRRILLETEAESYKIYIGGSDNFRYEYNPDYKANRKDTPRPTWLEDTRECLVVNHQATICNGQEADDALGIYQCNNINTVIVGVDKDLLMIPGNHYNFVTSTFREQSQVAAMQWFYYQLIMGDRSDNIFGFDGVARATVPKKLETTISQLNNFLEEKEMFEFVRDLYNDDDRLLMNGRCLWIRRQEGEIWQFPT